ncbi:DNA topoisomerase 4 subunit A [bacterium]|nr:DNA topoisomerase 4 subunit A [bacterium]
MDRCVYRCVLLELEMAEIDTSLQQESRDRYLTYALSVVTGRALPDVRDGLKPVQRRILYAMFHNLKLKPEGSHRKSAAVVGEVLARYHPHGDTACYDALVRMAQDFSLRYPLIDGQGNFGSLDGDSPAAYRYTESKLLPVALEALGEIHEETVAYRENFDATVFEPEVLPSRIPQLLMNGASGIAVGMATSIPPHNLSELVKGLKALLKDPEISTAKLTNSIKGPDFPTGCQILNSKQELTEIYRTGRGAIRMRGEWKTEDQPRGKQALIITSIPYALNKSQLVEKIADLIIAKKVPQIVDVRDESTDEVRIVLELAPEADAQLAAAFLCKHTALESNFPVNFTALTPTGGESSRPELLSLKDCLQFFLDFREEVVEKRLRFERKNLAERVHILEGLVLIYDALDEALKIIRGSSGRSDAAQKLRKRFKLSEVQSFAVVDMRVYQLSKTAIADIRKELDEKVQRIRQIDSILRSRSKILALVEKDLDAVDKAFGDKRKSKIVKDLEEIELNASDFIVQEDVYAIVTEDGWIKRIRQSNDPETTRVREGDAILQAHAVSTVDTVVFVTNLGYLYTVAVDLFPASSGYGSPIQKILKFRDGERIVQSFTCFDEVRRAAQEKLLEVGDAPSISEGDELVLVSASGMGYILQIEELGAIKKNGKRIMKLRDGDELRAGIHSQSEVAIFTEQGYALVLKKKEIPVRNQPAIGVILIGVKDEDQVVGAVAKTKRILITPSAGKVRDVTFGSLPKGRRGLRGKKVVSRAVIEAVEEKV